MSAETQNMLLSKKPIQTLSKYRTVGGYEGLMKALGMAPAEVIREMTASGLMGRGGAAFSVGKKWSFVSAADGKEKLVVCNADEGEAGTYKDRELLKNSPFRILEGMTIAAYAVGANHGVLFCRGEYRFLQPSLSAALEEARAGGWLGTNVGGKVGFNFDIELVGSAGAYICGEETALLNAIEGKRGEPRNRPPFPANKGLFGKPTLINNTETFANVSLIFRIGAQAYAAMGTKKSRGRKLISIAGQAKNRGVFEIELGAVTVKDIVYDERFGGGSADGTPIKACHMGGQSAAIVFPEQFFTPVTYEDAAVAGISIGSGAVVVLDESVCLVDYCRQVMGFFVHESCGKCAPCRIGTRRIADMLTDLCEFKAPPGTVDKLEETAKLLAANPACGLGKTAPSALLSALKYRRSEFEAHERKSCAAGKCGYLGGAGI